MRSARSASTVTTADSCTVRAGGSRNAPARTLTRSARLVAALVCAPWAGVTFCDPMQREVATTRAEPRRRPYPAITLRPVIDAAEEFASRLTPSVLASRRDRNGPPICDQMRLMTATELTKSGSPGMADCPFCEPAEGRIRLDTPLAIAIVDGYPVTTGHTLITPRRHVADYWGLTEPERLACHDLLVRMRDKICASDPTVTGFNIGLNAGASAGQTIFHCHFHLIPRRDGDVPDPRGGVRHVIPGKGAY
jgi:diadenosine tetraphosphate (Ap4A) HIT family hydrolase